MIRKVCFFGPKKMRFMQTESVLQTKNQSRPAKKSVFCSPGFYHIWAWRPPWSCDPDALNKLLFPRPMEAPHEIWLQLAQRFWRRRSLKMVDGQRTDDRSCLYYKLTNEPKGSGELKMPYFPGNRKLQGLILTVLRRWFWCCS